jgi:hypothetical protein
MRICSEIKKLSFFKKLKKQMEEMEAAYVGDHFDTKRIAVALKMAEIINF